MDNRNKTGAVLTPNETNEQSKTSINSSGDLPTETSCIFHSSATSSTETSATTFPRFAELAIELQLKIWNIAMDDEERIVEIQWDEKAEWCYSTTPAPPVLHVCQVSRQEALKRYELVELTSPFRVVDTKDLTEKGGKGKGASYGPPELCKDIQSGLSDIPTLTPRESDNPSSVTLKDYKPVKHESTADVGHLIFRAYVNFDLDTINLSGGHLLSSSRYPKGKDEVDETRLWVFIHSLRTTGVQNLAFDGPGSATSIFPSIVESDGLAELLVRGFIRLNKVILVQRDTCCKNNMCHRPALRYTSSWGEVKADLGLDKKDSMPQKNSLGDPYKYVSKDDGSGYAKESNLETQDQSGENKDTGILGVKNHRVEYQEADAAESTLLYIVVTSQTRNMRVPIGTGASSHQVARSPQSIGHLAMPSLPANIDANCNMDELVDVLMT